MEKVNQVAEKINELKHYKPVRYEDILTRGFDEIARDTGFSKDQVKEFWNESNLGFKNIPRTLIGLRYYANIDWKAHYNLTENLVVFITPIHPIFIPKQMITDLGSVPSLVRFIVDKDDPKFLIAYLVHDFLYITKITTKAVADQLLYDIAIWLGASRVTAKLVYEGVVIGWRSAWDSDEVEAPKLRRESLRLGLEYFEKNIDNLKRLNS